MLLETFSFVHPIQSFKFLNPVIAGNVFLRKRNFEI